LSRWVASTHHLAWLFGDAADTAAVEVPPEVGLDSLGAEVTVTDPACAASNGVGEGVELTAAGSNQTNPDGYAAMQTSNVDVENRPGVADAPAPTKHRAVFHPKRIRIALFVALVLTIINTILVVQILTPCDIGLTCVLSCIWGFLLSYCWNCLSMLRMSLVPGGRESEFAGLYLALCSSMIWLPLLVFSVANELWSIDGALYVLTIFFGVGALVLLFVDVDRALAAREHTLGLRRWAHLLVQRSNDKGAGAGGEKASEAGTVVDGGSAAGSSVRMD
jgi:hypothetical protein